MPITYVLFGLLFQKSASRFLPSPENLKSKTAYSCVVSNNQFKLKMSFLGKTCLVWFTPVTTTPYCLIPNCFLHLPYRPSPHWAFEFENHNLIYLWYFLHIKSEAQGYLVTQPVTVWTGFQTQVSWLLLQASFHLTTKLRIWRLASVNYF